MAIYTVHEPADASDEVTRADRTAFVREGFTVWGFLFAPFFLLWHRIWFAFVAWIVAVGVIVALASLLHVSPAACASLFGLLHLFVGVEGNDMRRWALARRGSKLIDVVSGPDRVLAELVFFGRREDTRPVEARPPANWTAVPDPTPAVIGMFPDGERS